MTFLEKKLRGLAKKLLRHAAQSSEVERAEQIFYLTYVQSSMTIFDVGANIGELTLLFSRFAPEGHVHAFEATARAFSQLTMVCEAGQRTNIVLNQVAVTDKVGTVPFHVYDDEHLSWSSMADRPLKNYGIEIPPARVEQVPATTIDDYCRLHNITKIDLLKVDVEGAEYQVLLGARRMLEARMIDCLTFEFGQTTFDMGNTATDIEDYLTGLNYKIQNVVPGNPNFPGRRSVEKAMFSVHVATPR